MRGHLRSWSAPGSTSSGDSCPPAAGRLSSLCMLVGPKSCVAHRTARIPYAPFARGEPDQPPWRIRQRDLDAPAVTGAPGTLERPLDTRPCRPGRPCLRTPVHDRGHLPRSSPIAAERVPRHDPLGTLSSFPPAVGRRQWAVQSEIASSPGTIGRVRSGSRPRRARLPTHTRIATNTASFKASQPRPGGSTIQIRPSAGWATHTAQVAP